MIQINISGENHFGVTVSDEIETSEFMIITKYGDKISHLGDYSPYSGLDMFKYLAEEALDEREPEEELAILRTLSEVFSLKQLRKMISEIKKDDIKANIAKQKEKQ